MHEVYFQNGFLCHIAGIPDNDIYDNRQFAYEAKVIYSDGIRYDMSSAASIRSIPIPVWEDRCAGNVTRCLDYTMRMIAGHIRKNDHNLSLICMIKAIKLMQASPIGWRYKDYWRLCEWLYEDGFVEKAEQFDKFIEYKYSFSAFRKAVLENVRNTCIELKTDIVELTGHGGTCALCARYRNRFLSVSGKDKRFMQIPAEFWEQGGFHAGCRCFPVPVFYPGSKPRFCSVEEVEAISNRPMEDDRTEREIAQYKQFLKTREQDKRYFVNRRAYLVLKLVYPDEVIMSFSAFCRLRDKNEQEYERLLSMATKLLLT